MAGIGERLKSFARLSCSAVVWVGCFQGCSLGAALLLQIWAAGATTNHVLPCATLGARVHHTQLPLAGPGWHVLLLRCSQGVCGDSCGLTGQLHGDMSLVALSLQLLRAALTVPATLSVVPALGAAPFMPLACTLCAPVGGAWCVMRHTQGRRSGWDCQVRR